MLLLSKVTEFVNFDLGLLHWPAPRSVSGISTNEREEQVQEYKQGQKQAEEQARAGAGQL